MSSSESEDENLKKLAEAVDVKLFDNSFYKPEEKKEKELKKTETQKSQRYLDDEENAFHSELNVSESMKGFIAKKMSSLIEKEVEFVDVKQHKNKSQENHDCVKLLRGYKEALKCEDPVDETIRTKVDIKRRKIDGNDEVLTESSKISLASTDINKIQREISFYNKKAKDTFKFKTAKDGKSYLVEPTNEYTKARKKNQWNESQIKNFKFYGQSLNKALTDS